jgi:hypothetical protein
MSGSMNRSNLKRNLLMLKLESVVSSLKFLGAPVSVGVLCLAVALVALLPAASAQDFTLTMAPFSTDAVNPGGEASSNITVGSTNFSGTVDLACQVTPQPSTGPTPNCQLSPTSVTPPAGATATVTTNVMGVDSPPGLYTVTVTGTASGGSLSHSAQQNLTVLAVTPDFTITVTQAVVPSSVHAGSGGEGTISVNPLNGYSGSVTLSCASITPLVTIPPVCSFNPNPVTVNGSSATTTLSINTINPNLPTGAVVRARPWYALWIPMLALVGVCVTSGRRPRRAWFMFALLVLGGAILLMPACGNTSSTTTTTTGVTPNNTYTFTLMGVDANGVTSSNTGTNTAPTVTLTVD